MSDEEILYSKSGPQTAGLPPVYRLLLETTDELHSDAHVSDATWQELSEY